ncbi:SH3 domain-containing protein [Litorimonas sp.]|uniref:SH3 domain-containing protein n=1 Tax=Litorimonas sp. TaxID=1892381 RepID=UPI003A840898
MGKFLRGRPSLAVFIAVFLVTGTAAAQINAASPAVTTEVKVSTETPKRQVKIEPVPATPSDGFFRKAANRTPSGFEVPRYVSLKFGKVNGRTGPSRNHSIAWQYRRRDLPLIVVAETEMWRKVRDINGDEAWVRKPALSGERFVMAMKDIVLMSKPETGADAVARSETGVLFRLEECNTEGWCRIKARNGLKGWVVNHQLWGAQNL